ncbi:MAG: nicotinate (nicotinamide) nucleotide adenylyltransferase [bacterium]
MNIGIYSGTFNPIHIGHVTVINYSIEELKLDLLYVVPNKYPVHKKRKYFLEPSLRIQMIQYTLEESKYYHKVQISDFEITSNQDSYSYITVDYFRKKHPIDTLFFIIGIDSLIFHFWHNFDSIWEKIDYFAVINRNIESEDLKIYMKQKLEDLKNKALEYNEILLKILDTYLDIDKKFILLKIPRIEISSSLIWQRLEESKSIDYWVNEKVKKILYSIPLGGEKRNTNPPQKQNYEHTR